ncbi:MAG TPA: HAMP domain-containing sensor histidine kinase [Planctomycetota bacterium]|nr:HAMP domain-containing sensor histidine kinase [Planctomycetota bacterium]
MISTRRILQAYWGVLALVLVLLAWWVVFFSRQGDYLIARIARSGESLTAEEAHAVRAASNETLRMFLSEGLFLVLLLIGGMALIVRSMHRELLAYRQHKDFLSAVTHELRSPIASARLYLESLLLGRAEGEKARRYLEHAIQDIDRLTEQVDGLLAAARLQRTMPEVVSEVLDLSAHVRSCVQDIEQAGLAPGARLEFHTSGAVVASADPRAVSAIVANLVSNALKYGGDPPRVEVNVASAGNRAELSVRDFGPGLRGADAQSIFKPFVRGDDNDVRMRPGIGLGLYMVAELTRALHGDLSAEDHLEGGGMRVCVWLPKARAGAGA